MFSWLKRLLSDARSRKKLNEELANLPTQHADTSGNLPLDPKNDPWGRR
ncbi:MAG: hypothetical protein V4735_07865 [Pseudomonadota bacterium]